MPRAAAKPSTANPGLFDALATRAEKQAAELAGGNRFTPPYLSIDQVKERSGQRNIVKIVNPQVRDAENKAEATPFDSLEIVILAHVMTRRLVYTGADQKIHKELFSVGPRNTGVAIGTAIGGYMPWTEVERRYPDGFPRDVIEYNTDHVVRKDLKPDSRYYVVAALRDNEARTAAGDDLITMFLPMTSVYGATMLDKPSAAPDRARTLMAYSDKQDPEGHKGIFHVLKSRPWEAGIAAGLDEERAARTPQNAIWLTVSGSMLGDVPRPVPAFDIGDELDQEHLEWAFEAQERANDILLRLLMQDAADAWPPFIEAQRKIFASAAIESRWDEVANVARLAVPLVPEVVDEGEDEAPSQAAARPATRPAAPPPTQIIADDEFPPEHDLPF